MRLDGSCHCKAVRFSLESAQPYPFMRCYCSICRKTAGAGGYAINLAGDNRTLLVQGRENLSVYQAQLDDGTLSSGQRNFCRFCGSALWLWDPNWPELIHPHASAIDTELPVPPEHVHILLDSKAGWVEIEGKPGDRQCQGAPDESLAQWHERLGLTR